MVIVNNNFILNRFFSQATFDNALNIGTNSIYDECVKQYVDKANVETNIEIIEELYHYLQKNYRNEYFYKNTLFNKNIIGKHSLHTTTALTEVPIHKSKADFIKINGKAIVYEIKTELDSLERLEQQLADYYKAFTNIYVITSESNEEKVGKMLTGTNVGLMVLTKRNQFSERKKAMEDYSLLDKEVMFKVLRKDEFEAIIEGYYGFLPETKPVFYYSECFLLFNKIPLLKAHELFVKELKKRNKLNVQNYLEHVPYELRFLAYFSQSIQKNYQELSRFLKNDWRY